MPTASRLVTSQWTTSLQPACLPDMLLAYANSGRMRPEFF
jgi:hypothetical protein